MGTRHLTMVVVDGDYKVAQYGQWDGYPSGQGLTILEFLRNKFDRAKFVTRVALAYEPTSDQIKQLYLDLGANPEQLEQGMVDYAIGQKFNEAHPSLGRDAGANILSIIQDSIGDGVPIRRDVEFAADSLFCEYAYVVDLDKNTFEAFQGFNKEPLDESERFAGLTEKCKNEYHPVKLVCSFSLDALPDNDDFLAAAEPRDEDEDDGEQAQEPAALPAA